jgi:antitoxin YefM
MYTVDNIEVLQQIQFLIQKVVQDHEPVRIVNARGENVILISEHDYESLKETLYLLSNPVNAERLRHAQSESLKQAISWQTLKDQLKL